MVERLTAGLLAAFLLQQPVFHSATRLVVLHVTVETARGEPVVDLPQGAFTVYENGKRQPVALFSRDDVPVSLGLLIDNSGSMRLLRARVEAAALALAHASNPQDEIFVLNFADTARIDVPFTRDLRVLEAGIARVDSIGGTAMHDALGFAEDYVAKGTRDRKVLLVVTDGDDNASMTTAERVEQVAQQREIAVYAVGLLGDTPKGRHARHQLERLVERTGGAAYFPAGIDDIDTIALRIARQIRTQYTIAYAPTNQALDGSYRTLKVTVDHPDHLVVRTRTGYRATASQGPIPIDPQ